MDLEKAYVTIVADAKSVVSYMKIVESSAEFLYRQ